MPDYAVSTAFYGKDKGVSDAFERMGRSADKFNSKASSAFSKVERGSDRASSAMRNATKEGYKFGTIVKGIVAANILRGGIGLVGSAIQKVGSDFIGFEDIIVGAAARFDDIGPSADNLQSKVIELGKAVRASIKGTRFSAVDAAQATNELAKAGYVSSAALAIMPRMLEFATANQEKLAEATTMSSDILGAFSLRDKDVQKQLGNHIRLNDMLTKSSLLSTGGLRDLYETLQQTAPLSAETGMKPEELLAASVVLSNAGIKGTEAATAIKRAMLNIYAANSPMADEFKANGIAIADQNGKLKKFSVVLGEISAKLKPLTEEQRLPILRRIFGVYGLAGSLKLMRSIEQAAEFEKKIGDSAGTTKLVNDAQNMSTYAKLVALGNAALEKSFQVLERFNKPGQKGIEGITEKINNFKPEPLIKSLEIVGSTLWTLYKIMEPFIPLIPYFIAGWAALNVVMKVIAISRVAYAFGLIAQSLIVGLGPVGAMTTAMGALGAAVAAVATPLLALIAAGGIGAALYSGYTGKDNFISRFAQDIGLVPKLTTDEQGRVNGFADNSPAPNRVEAETRQAAQFRGQLNIAGAPPGSTVENQSGTGAPSIGLHLLGAQ